MIGSERSGERRAIIYSIDGGETMSLSVASVSPRLPLSKKKKTTTHRRRRLGGDVKGRARDGLASDLHFFLASGKKGNKREREKNFVVRRRSIAFFPHFVFFDLALFFFFFFSTRSFVRSFARSLFFFLSAFPAMTTKNSNALVSSLLTLAESGGNKGAGKRDAEVRFNAAVADSLVASSKSTSFAADNPAFLEAARRILLSEDDESSKDTLLTAVASWLRNQSASSPSPFSTRLGAALGPAVAAAASAAAGSLGELKGALRAAAAAYAIAVRGGGGGGSGRIEAAVPSAAASPPPPPPLPAAVVALPPLRARPPAPLPPPPVEQVLALGSPYHTPKRSPGKFSSFDLPPKEEEQQQQQEDPEAEPRRPHAGGETTAAAAGDEGDLAFDDDELISAPLALFALWAPRLSDAAQVEAARCTLAAVSRGCPGMRDEVVGEEGGGYGAGSPRRGRWPPSAASAAARSLAHSRLRGPGAREAAALAAAALHARAARELDAAGLISARAAVAFLS